MVAQQPDIKEAAITSVASKLHVRSLTIYGYTAGFLSNSQWERDICSRHQTLSVLGLVVDVVKSVSMASEHGKAIISESLLAKIPEKHSKEAHKRFNLGLGDWTESSSKEETEKENQAWKLKLTLNKKGKGEQSSRWHFVDDEEDSLSIKFVPKNTATSTKWAVTNFENWRKCRNDRFANESEKQGQQCCHC